MKKWLSENYIQIILIYFAYSITWYFAWHLSINFQTIAHITSWFLPAGIRFSSLILLHKRYWPVIAVAEISSIYAVNYSNSPFTTIYGLIIGTFVPIIIYMLCVNWYLKRSKAKSLNTMQSVINLQLASGMCASFTAIFLVTSLALQEQVPIGDYVITLISFVLGDFIGMLLLFPLMLIASLILRKRLVANIKVTFNIFNTTVLLISSTLSILLIYFEMVYYLKLFSFIPIIIFAYKYGWLGSAISIVIINIIITVASLFDSNVKNMFDLQLYLVAISTTGLFLGAAISEQVALHKNIAIKNKELSLTNINSKKLMNKNQELAGRITSIQENERKIISRELHDEIGQNITALKLNLGLAKKMVTEKPLRELLESSNNIADITYDSAYNLMHYLRPRIIDNLGLHQALQSKLFKSLLETANIKYHCDIKGDCAQLSEDFNIAIFRIVQESINNSAKYSKATHLWLKLHIKIPVIKLEIKDNGNGFNIDEIKKSSGSFGLQGIEDRVTALGGTYQLSSNTEGTKHSVIFTHLPDANNTIKTRHS